LVVVDPQVGQLDSHGTSEVVVMSASLD